MLDKIIDVVRRAGEIVRSAQNVERSVHEKSGRRDLVTEYDARVQQFLQKELLSLLPGAGFMGEESWAGEDYSGCEWLFIVDPIDGTTNFIQGFHNSSISVGLLHNGRPEYGVVYNPYDGELYAARRGCGATLNGKPIHTHDPELADALLILGSAVYYRELVEPTLAIFNAVFPLVQDVRRFGSAALDLCYLAAGKAGVFFECRLCPWDIAAGALIAAEAGCELSQLDGAPLDLFHKRSVLAGSPRALAEFRAAMPRVQIP